MVTRYLSRSELAALYRVAANMLEAYGRRVVEERPGLQFSTALDFAYYLNAIYPTQAERQQALGTLQQMAQASTLDRYHGVLQKRGLRTLKKALENARHNIEASLRLHKLSRPRGDITPNGLRTIADRIESA